MTTPLARIPSDPFLTIQDVADELGVTDRTVNITLAMRRGFDEHYEAGGSSPDAKGDSTALQTIAADVTEKGSNGGTGNLALWAVSTD